MIVPRPGSSYGNDRLQMVTLSRETHTVASGTALRAAGPSNRWSQSSPFLLSPDATVGQQVIDLFIVL